MKEESEKSGLERKVSPVYGPIPRLEAGKPYLMTDLELATNKDYRLLLIQIKQNNREFTILDQKHISFIPTEKGVGILYSDDEECERKYLKKYVDKIDLNPNTAHTLNEVGIVMNITRERVRQIENKALKKLRHPTRRILLEEYTKHTKKY